MATRKLQNGDQGWTIVVINQFTMYVQTVQRGGWYPIGPDPTVEMASSRKNMTVLEADTHAGEAAICRQKRLLPPVMELTHQTDHPLTHQMDRPSR